MKKNNSHKATIILVIFTLGYLITYPFHENFWIGLLANMCAASMIGGLADWFAVTAIFRRPLGIYWPRGIFRTEIIPRNREKIVIGLVDIIENELLSKENIKKKIIDINLYDLLIMYIEDQTIGIDLKGLLKKLIIDFYQSLAPEKMDNIVEETLVYGASHLDLSEQLAKFIDFLRERGYDDIIIDQALELFTGFIKYNKTHNFFTNFVENIIAEYESGIQSRGLAIKMLLNFVLKKTPSDLAVMLEDGIANAIYEVKNRDNTARAKIKDQIDKLVMDLKVNDELRNKIESWKNTMLPQMSIISREIGIKFREFKESSNINNTKIEYMINHYWDMGVERLTDNRIQNERIDNFIKEAIIDFVNNKHNTIGLIVKDKIDKFSTSELVELIEGIAGNDLQMIRINGSVVGGMVGILTYLLTYYLR